jgi:hypothetical protein
MVISASAATVANTPVKLTVTTARAWQPSAAPAVLAEIDAWLRAGAEKGIAAEQAAAAAREQAQRLRAMTGQPSPHAAAIRELTARRTEIEEAINGLAAPQQPAAA